MARKIPSSIPRPKPNYFLSIISISLVLFLLGLVAFLSLHTNKLIDTFKENVNVITELRDSVSLEETDSLIEFIKLLPAVKLATIDLVNKEEALTLMKKEMGDDFLLDEMSNPLNDVVVFNVKSAYLDSTNLKSVKSSIMDKFPCVTNVFYQETFVDKVSVMLSKIGWAILGISILFLLIALTVMHSTIKLSMYSNRFLIKNMQLVGASKGFIQRPFLGKGILCGFLSSIVSLLLLSGVIYGMITYIPDIEYVIDWRSTGILYGIIVLGGIFITVLSTFLIVNRYIRLRKDDMF